MTRSIGDAAFSRVADDLAALVRIPSLSSPDADPEPIERSAAAVAGLLAEVRCPDVRVLRASGGRPAVVGRWPAPAGKPTVLLYAHHDVQPSGSEEAWTTPAFEPTIRGGRLYGRGAADNKAGVVAHAAALRAHGGEPPVGVVVLVEGEEEIGSPTLEALLDEHDETLRADLVCIADSAMLRVGQPAITVSMRGLVDCVVEVRTLRDGVHSGVFGGLAPDALSALARLLATLHDEQARVAIPGLAEATPVLAAGITLDGKELRANLGALPYVLGPDADDRAAVRAWSEAAVAVIGVDGPAVAGSANQLVPAASAKISLRVPPGVSAATASRLLQEHLRASAPWGAHVDVYPGSAADPFLVDTTDPLFVVVEDAFAQAWQEPPIRIGTGGTIPVVGALARRLEGAPLLLFGATDRTSRTHAPNESVDLVEVQRTALAEALLLDALAS